jgi:hypothetical protein
MGKQTEVSAKPSILPEHDDPETFHIFLVVKTTRHWLDLEGDRRRTFLEESVRPLFRARREVKVRWFEPEAFSATATDILICETKDLSAWAWICDELRETLFWNHYFEIVEIWPTLEGNYLSRE